MCRVSSAEGRGMSGVVHTNIYLDHWSLWVYYCIVVYHIVWGCPLLETHFDIFLSPQNALFCTYMQMLLLFHVTFEEQDQGAPTLNRA